MGKPGEPQHSTCRGERGDAAQQAKSSTVYELTCWDGALVSFLLPLHQALSSTSSRQDLGMPKTASCQPSLQLQTATKLPPIHFNHPSSIPHSSPFLGPHSRSLLGGFASEVYQTTSCWSVGRRVPHRTQSPLKGAQPGQLC